MVLEDIEGVYAMIEECLAEKKKVELSETGQLIFNYSFQPNRRRPLIERTFSVTLNEVEVGEDQRLQLKV